MSDFLFYYRGVDPTTWLYLSSLLSIGLFFKFGRIWSVRNLDLILLISLGPGLLLIYYGQERQGILDQSARDNAEVVSTDPSVNTEADAGTPTDAPKPTEWQRLEVWGFIYLFTVGVLILTRLLLDPIMVIRNLPRGFWKRKRRAPAR